MRIKHIDGIRAISVIAVILFHAFPSQFPNGYLGVDYFLVISGFVISRKYLFQSNHEFDIVEFWRKRINRLYPQMLTCILLCIPFAFVLMQPDYLENFSQSVIATLLGSNNILLFLTGGYWTIANEMKPLFTTWSLGIEEQFYLFGSLILFWLGRDNKKLISIFCIITISSLLLCTIGSIAFQKANYLLLPFRFWEFSLGIIACYLLVRKPTVTVTSVVSNIAFVLLIACLCFPYPTIKYSPSPFLLVPLVATAALCISTSYSSISLQFLSSRPVTYIGLASYSIYLYHQPILAFARIRSFEELSSQWLIILIVFSVLFGILMYELIEQNRLSMIIKIDTRKQIISTKYYILASMALILSNIPVLATEGLFHLRFPYLLVDGQPPKGFLGGKGYTDHPYIYKAAPYSYSANKKSNIYSNLLLIGNSQTRDLINSLEILEKSLNIDLRFSYFTSVEDLIKNKNSTQILEKSNIVILQGSVESTLNGGLPAQLSPYKDKVLKYSSRDRFVYNINPALFTNNSSRKNLSVKNTDSIKCVPLDMFQVDQEQNVYKLFTQCAFNDGTTKKTIANSDGGILTFDGEHLSYDGASYLSSRLRENGEFIDYILQRSSKMMSED